MVVVVVVAEDDNGSAVAVAMDEVEAIGCCCEW